MEWPPGIRHGPGVPEVDRARWFGLEAARWKLVPGQVGFIDRLSKLVQGG